MYLLINMHMVSTVLDSRLFRSETMVQLTEDEMLLSSLSNVVNLFLKKKTFQSLILVHGSFCCFSEVQNLNYLVIL